jgi:FkbM family methyltransferase
MLSTAQKVCIARALSRCLLLMGVQRHQRVVRRGIRFELDLAEGIDLSIFLFGTFQRHVVGLIERFAARDGIVIDVGANIGAIALPAAAVVTAGHVYAIEPTEFAFAKLLKNIASNPQLAARITPVKTFFGETGKAASTLVAHSSWPLVGAIVGTHPVHHGVPMQAVCGQTTLDRFVLERNLAAVALVKIDTDGHEFTVLKGALQCLARHRPVVIFEACEYLMQAPSAVFEDFERLFRSCSYGIHEASSLRPIRADDFRRSCPAGGGMDLLALPDERLAAA